MCYDQYTVRQHREQLNQGGINVQIIKRNGNSVLYDDQKIIKSILTANSHSEDVNTITENTAASIATEVMSDLAENSAIVTTAEIRDGVYRVLCERGYEATAKSYIEYKNNKL